MEYIIDENEEHKRLDKFVSEMFADISRETVQDAIKKGLVLVNDKPKKPSYSLKEKDKVAFDKSVFEVKPLDAEDIKLDIVYEDENMLVVNKPSGMLTHPAGKENSGTLVNALLNYCPETLSDIGGEFRRGIVHRLDRNTSGLLMIAKNNKTHEFLQKQIKEKTAIRKYYAVCEGKINQSPSPWQFFLPYNPFLKAGQWHRYDHLYLSLYIPQVLSQTSHQTCCC